MRSRKSPNKVIFAIRADDRLVGVVQLIHIDQVHRSAELTISIGEEANRGAGHGTSALEQAIDFAWRDLNLHRVWLRVFANNPRTIRAYEKAGFVHEGVLREAAYIDGRYIDMIAMAILRS